MKYGMLHVAGKSDATSAAIDPIKRDYKTRWKGKN
jgi:hypothetical protein